MIQLAQSGDGRLIIASNQGFTADVQRVEYYRDLKLFMLVFEGQEEEADLMPCEISDDMAKIVHNSPDVIVIAMKEGNTEPYGYIAPLVQIGI
jgi:hypothetical protein